VVSITGLPTQNTSKVVSQDTKLCDNTDLMVEPMHQYMYQPVDGLHPLMVGNGIGAIKLLLLLLLLFFLLSAAGIVASSSVL